MHRFPRHRTKLELLEARLPPGDALVGMLLAWPTTREATVIEPAWASAAASFLIDDVTALSIESDSQLNQRFISKPSSIAPAASATTIDSASDTLAHSPRQSRHIGASNGQPDFVVSTPWITAPVATAANVLRPPATIGTRTSAAIASSGLTPKTNVGEVQKTNAVQNYGQLPLSFEANHGQTDSRVNFIAKTGGATVFLTPTSAVFAMQNSEFRIQNSESSETSSAVEASRAASAAGSSDGSQSPTRTLTRHGSPGVALHLQIVGANPEAQTAGVNPLPGIVNYFIGNDPSQWHTNIPTFGRVEYNDVYPGIDLAYYGGQSRDGNGAGLEYDFIVSPGADPSAITLNFAGADGVELNSQGDLVLHTAAGDVVQQKPFTYQEVSATRQEVASRYVVDGTQVRFEVGAYDVTRALVIDPLVLGWSTYLGGALGDDLGKGIALNRAGDVYTTGWTNSSKFPTTAGAFDTTYNGGYLDVFVARLDASGSSLLYGTYLGGFGNDLGYSVSVDEAGSAYVTGITTSSDFPTTQSGFDATYNGGLDDAFVVKISPEGSSLSYATYLGGFDSDWGYSIDVNDSGNAFVTGLTTSATFPTTMGAFDASVNSLDAFAIKLHVSGSSLVYGTYLGGSEDEIGYGIAVDDTGNAYVTGFTQSADLPTTLGAFDTTYNGVTDAFVIKLNATGSTIAYGTYIGGTSIDSGYGIAVDAFESAYLTGFTISNNLPITPGALDPTYNGMEDAFVVKISTTGSGLDYCTYIGGAHSDWGHGIAVGASDSAYLTGVSFSGDLPITLDAFDLTHNGGTEDAYVIKLNADGKNLVYGTYLGTGESDQASAIVVDEAGNAYVTGITKSTRDFPTTPGAFKRRSRGGSEAFITKFTEM